MHYQYKLFEILRIIRICGKRWEVLIVNMIPIDHGSLALSHSSERNIRTSYEKCAETLLSITDKLYF